jgi:hypothetical protein
MKKTLSFILLIFCSSMAFAQSAIIIEPNPVPARGVRKNIQLDFEGRIVENPPNTYYYNISNIDFVPTGYLNENAFLSSFKRDETKYGTAYFVDGTVEDYWMVAPVDLPDGAVIDNLSAYFIDKSTGANSENLTIRLIRRTINQNLIPSPEVIIASAETTDGTTMAVRSVNTTITANNTVNNNLYTYFIKVLVEDVNIDVGYHWKGEILAIKTVRLRYNL